MDPPPLSFAPPIAASSPPSLPQITTSAAAAAINSYPNSLDSSPRSRNTDSWDEPPYGPAATAAPPQNPAAGGKLRLMCSYGGHIVPRPHDKSLCYIGGETRIIVSDRGTTLSDLVNRLSKTLLDGKPFALKYQLPNEDLDSLITVTTDEDFENMVDEYDRLLKTPSSRSRLRLFLFPAKSGSETSSSIESLLENSSKSNEWFFNALNSTSPAKSHRAISETSSVNCLLGLDDQNPPVPKGASESQSEKANANVPHQDVHSVPDSPMLETNSSFGSTSSSPSTTANKVGSEEGKGGIEEAQALQQQQVQVLPQPTAQLQQTKPVVVAAFDLASPDSVSSDGSGRNPLSRQKVVYVEPVVPAQLQSVNAQLAAAHIDPKKAELNTRAQMAQQVQENAYAMPSQFDQYQQVQYVPTGSQIMQQHHHHPSGAVPMYYSVYPSQQQQQQQQHQQHQHQYPPVYLMPTRPQAYNYPVPTYSDSVPATPSTRVQTPPSATLVPPTAFTPASNAAAAIAKPQQHLVPSPQYAGFSQFPHPSQTIAPSSATASYAYEYPEPTQAQIYYTQPLAPTQYQKMASNAQLKLPEISAPHPTETVKLQVRTTQP